MLGPTTEVQWLYEDASVLYRMGRKHSAILLLLCAVDALARSAYPATTKSSERFEQFLRSKMRRPGRAQVHNIWVPKRDRFFAFEYIIYKFLRCPLIHQGARLEASDVEFAVSLEWNDIPHGVKVDPSSGRVILGGELVWEMLEDAILHAASKPGA